MKLTVLPRLACEALPWAPGRAFISITNPRQAPAVLPHNQPILRLGFHDIDYPLEGWKEMTPANARAVLKFVENLPPETLSLVIHCEHGASRSSAAGIFLSAWLSSPLDWSGEGVPNPWVLRVLRRAAWRYTWCRPWAWLRCKRGLQGRRTP